MGLLIATDVPEALDPLEIKQESRRCPIRHENTHWLVGLSMGRMDAMVIDQKEFYNREYSESTANDKTEMSQEEMTFMQNAKETVRLEKGHYQISLPFNHRDILVSNNKTQALQRTGCLKKRLQRDPKFCEAEE